MAHSGGRDIVVIGASAGGEHAIPRLLSSLPADVRAAFFVVKHSFEPNPVTSLASQRNTSARVLGSGSKLPTDFAADHERIQLGHVYIAPPGEHLLVERGIMHLEASPKEAWSRPGINPLFRSAALAYGRRVIGVLLTGRLYDGTAGMWEIKKRGGVTIVQNPEESLHPEMPLSALSQVQIDYCLRLEDIADKIVALSSERPASPPSGHRTAKILIVEDERIVALNLEKRLSRLGYEVSGSVSSGPEAIASAAQVLPDVVLMDICLAGPLTGTETARRLWERFQVPVVYVTAYADSATLDDVKTTEPYGYVVKPFRPEEVHAAIQLALDRRDKETRDF